VNRSAVADALLPGAGLIVDGRPAAGIPLLVPTVFLLAVLLLAAAIGGFAAAWVLPRALPAYVLLAVIAALVRWRIACRQRIDPQVARQLARDASQAWLRGDPAATAIATKLTGAAPEMAQAWRLHALVSGDVRSAKRATTIEQR